MRRLPALLVLFPLAASAQELGLPDGLYAEITTPRGVITCELEFAGAPLTVTSFVGLAEGTLGPAPRKPFFDGLTFHRVVPNFVAQGGDPLGTGEGGPGYSFPDEFTPALAHDAAGVLSMANEGPDTNGSQFFITLAPLKRLNYLHSVFGRTIRGLDFLPRIAQGDRMQVHILRVGAAAAAFRADDAAFAALLKNVKRYDAEKEPGPRSLFDDPDKLLPSDPPRARNFNFKLGNVQRATGLRISVRLLAKFAPGPGAGDPKAFADGLEQTPPYAGSAVVAVYFADRDEWALAVAAPWTARFTGEPRDTGKPASEGSLEAAKTDFLRESRVRAAAYAAQSKMILPNILQTQAQQVKVSVDAVMDGLIDKLAPRQ